jgi:hypothetical protein
MNPSKTVWLNLLIGLLLMSLIYEPKGKAREYSPLALNTYSGGCDHQ